MKKISVIFFVLIFMGIAAQAVLPERIGWWKFDNSSSLLKAEAGYGTDLILVGKHAAASGPETGNSAVIIGPGNHYILNHSIPPSGTSSFVNEYSLQFDFKVPETGIWHSFFQTSPNNANDGDFFINPSGNIGVAAVGYSAYSVKANEWYRLIVSVKNGSDFTFYLDGNMVLSGTIQPKDGRFALDKQILVFADDDGEDGRIYCAELGIWNQALNAEQAKELGGFGHDVRPVQMTRIPYLQGGGTNSMNICWHDTAQIGTKVEYGLDSILNKVITGTSELIGDPFRWHTVKLTGLAPNTRYFYRVSSGNEVSGIYSFKTLPDESYSGKIRFVLFSDTHDSDTASASKVLRAARTKITEIYGPDIENHVNGIFHSGDLVVSGNSLGQYTTQYFQPFAALSANIPTMAVAGNHEGESPYFYKYMKLDDQSAYPNSTALNEKIWQMRVGNSLFIGLNTNIIDQYGTTEANWLDTKLKETENDASIDFVFLFMHHPPYSELWFDVSTFDGGANYVKNVLFPIIRKYTKVQQLHSGHTHGFERGTVLSPKVNGDFRFIIGGGGGGPLDNWGDFTNLDYPDIHVALDHFCFQILEIDIADHSYQNSMYSLGNQFKSKDIALMDNWYKKINQTGPNTPVIENAQINTDNIQFNTSPFSGADSLMSVEMKVTELSGNSAIVLDSLVHWKNIYGVDKNYIPIDKNNGINLNQLKVSKSLLSENKSYSYSVRYRDHNLKWSSWSNAATFNTDGIISGINAFDNSSGDYALFQNYPNPFSQSTIFPYQIQKSGNVSFRILDLTGNEIRYIDEGEKSPGKYNLQINSGKMESGIYFLLMKTDHGTISRKMILSR
jgi:Icc-related predicted phosphoesterase